MIDFVAAPLTNKEQKAMQRSISRGVLPFGDERWVKKTVRRLGLDSTLRDRGRPRKLPKSP
jgi:putative transposase